MYLARILLRDLPKFYRNMTFLSYQMTEFRLDEGQSRTQVIVGGTHPDCHLVTIVQSEFRADIIAELDSDPLYEDEAEDHDAEGEEPTRTMEERALLEPLGAAAFEVAHANAVEAGVIRPTLTSGIETHQGNGYNQGADQT